MTDTTDHGRAFTTDYPPALDMYAAHYTGDDQVPGPMPGPMQPDPGGAVMNAAVAGLQAATRQNWHADLSTARRAIMDLLDALDQLAGPSIAEPIRRAVDRHAGLAFGCSTELVITADERDRAHRHGRELLDRIDQLGRDVDTARDMAARLEEQIANGWLSYYTAQLEHRIQELVATVPVDSLAGNDGEHRRQMYDTIVTRARDTAHAEIAAAAAAGAVQRPPSTTADDISPVTDAIDVLARQPTFRMNAFGQGVPVLTDPDLEPGLIEIRDGDRLLGRIRIDTRPEG